MIDISAYKKLPELSCKNRIRLTRKNRRSSFIGVPLCKINVRFDCDSNQNKTTCRKKNERVFRLLLYNNKDDNDTIFISFPCFEEKERGRERECVRIAIVMREIEKEITRI